MGGGKTAFFGHCWRLYTQTNTNNVNDFRIVDNYYDEFIDIVSRYIKANPETKVYCFMHWNYDLEKLPFPLHLNVARKLVDNGVEAVIGCHSHRPQAAEIYKGKPIAYGLGNFYLPSGLFFSGKLNYPKCSQDTYALVLSNGDVKIQWFKTDDSTLKTPIVQGKEEGIGGPMIVAISKGIDLPMSQYVSYFRKNRLKKILVPVFVDYKSWKTKLKEYFAILRVKIIRKLK